MLLVLKAFLAKQGRRGVVYLMSKKYYCVIEVKVPLGSSRLANSSKR